MGGQRSILEGVLTRRVNAVLLKRSVRIPCLLSAGPAGRSNSPTRNGVCGRRNILAPTQHGALVRVVACRDCRGCIVDRPSRGIALPVFG